MVDNWGGSWAFSWATSWGGFTGIAGIGILLAGDAVIDGAGTVTGTGTGHGHGRRIIYFNRPGIDHWRE